MSGHAYDDPQSVKKEIRTYLMVFLVLAVLTVVTVGISYLHLAIHFAIILALIVATFKASLVAGFFMHLISERQLIYSILIFVVIFFVGLLLLPLANHSDYITGTKDDSRELLAVSASHDQSPSESHGH